MIVRSPAPRRRSAFSARISSRRISRSAVSLPGLAASDPASAGRLRQGRHGIGGRHRNERIAHRSEQGARTLPHPRSARARASCQPRSSLSDRAGRPSRCGSCRCSSSAGRETSYCRRTRNPRAAGRPCARQELSWLTSSCSRRSSATCLISFNRRSSTSGPTCSAPRA